MIRLLYVSNCTYAITAKQIQDILLPAQLKNLRLSITGVLLYGGGVFMQVLEGPEQEVLKLYMQITQDKRHNSCQIIHFSPAAGRMFGDWSMGIIEGDPLDYEHVMHLKKISTKVGKRNAFTDTLNTFLNKLNGLPAVYM